MNNIKMVDPEVLARINKALEELVKLVTFATEDMLTPEHLPFIEDMFDWAETGALTYTIEATDEVRFLASVLDGIDRS